MKNVWRKLRDNWLDFWEDDELDMDKKHLSQHDKRSLLYGGFMILNVFEAVKQSVTTRQAAEHYGIRVGRNGMCVCPFHDDKNPSMKVDRRFHCFGCQADGDVIDFVSRLENVSPKEAALMLAQDFSIPYEDKEPPSRSRRPQPRQESPEQQFRRMERHCFRVLSD